MTVEFVQQRTLSDIPRPPATGGRVVVSHLNKGVGQIARDALSVKIVLEGEERYTIAGRSHILRPGEVLIVEPGGAVDVRVPGIDGARGLCLHMPAPTARSINTDKLHMDPLHLPAVDRSFGRWLTHAASLVSKHEDLDGRISSWLLSAASGGLLKFLETTSERAAQLDIASSVRRTEVLRRVERARAFLHANLERAVSLDELSEVAGLSRFYLARAFKTIHGAAPAAYHRKQRLEEAATMLARDLRSPAELAESFGFADESSFSRAFKRQHGLPPVALRKAGRSSLRG